MDPAHPLPARDSNAQQPPRSILKSSGARRDAHAQSASSSSAPQVQFKGLPPLSDPRTLSKSHLRSQKPIQNVHQIPNDGPVPPVTLPATASRNELEIMAFQLAAHLRELRIAEEEALKKQAAQRLPRPTGRPDDFPEFKKILMGPWAGGCDYGPILEPTLIVSTRYRDMLRPTGLVSIESLRSQPVTSPRLSKICVISHSFPWALRISAQERSTGVTVGEVLDFLAQFFAMPLRDGDLQDATPSHHAAMVAAHTKRTAQSPNPPSMCLHDWLLGRSLFDGFAHDPAYTSPDILGRVGEVYLRLFFKECR
ncbi:hypothetical protein CPB85DRAFT_881737 [Mucidula mucida]|nr:hypothetical protein CPB85DRAFT_881737 [Mucidula mucida]